MGVYGNKISVALYETIVVLYTYKIFVVKGGAEKLKQYTIREAFAILRQNKITTHEESVHRWLRQGVICGIPPETRRDDWRISEKDLFAFIRSRMPEEPERNKTNTTNDVNNKEAIRTEMWWELARKYIFEGAIEPKRKQIKTCVEHQRYSSAFEKEAWAIISGHTRGYSKRHIPYLLGAFLFNGERIRIDDNYEGQDERILYSLLEHIRQEQVER